jgi:hypothetical protein
MNTFQLRDAIARNSSNGTKKVLVVNFEEANASRYCIERSSSFSLLVRPCPAVSTSQLWVRTPAGDICVHNSPARCLYDDSTISEKGLWMTSQVQSKHQRWYTLRTGQLQLSGIDLCPVLLDLQATQSDTIAVPCSTTPILSIAFGHPYLNRTSVRQDSPPRQQSRSCRSTTS